MSPKPARQNADTSSRQICSSETLVTFVLIRIALESLKKIIKAIHSVGEVKSIHDLKTHRAGPMVYIQGHLVLDGNMNLFKAHDIVDEIEKKIRVDFPDSEIVLHMEPDTKSTYDDVVFFDSEDDKTE